MSANIRDKLWACVIDRINRNVFVTKKKSAEEAMSFEEALAQLEAVVRQLEDGQLGLSESLARYEQGVRYLQACHAALNAAEGRILLLTSLDEQGRPRTTPFHDQGSSPGAKAEAGRTRRTTRAVDSLVENDSDAADDDVDIQKGLF